MKIINIDDSINDYNTSPQDKFCGLSPSKIHEIIHNPLGENSPIKFKNDINNQILDKIPFFKITEEFLKIIKRDKFIKLTPHPKRNLIIVMLFEHLKGLQTGLDSQFLRKTQNF
jgi:hypothetical protein